MTLSSFEKGSTDEFNLNWEIREEAKYSHFVPLAAKLQNQIQFAFRQHFLLFKSLFKSEGNYPDTASTNSNFYFCELGAGRGSLSGFFSSEKYRCTLVDTSETALNVAKRTFDRYGLQAEYLNQDIFELSPALNEKFDVVTSIGLCEHFDDVAKVLNVHHQLLKPGGRAFCYIVPRDHGTVQKYAFGVNLILAFINRIFGKKQLAKKADVYRNGYFSDIYVRHLKNINVTEVQTFGVYPYPMISPSISFPFTLCPSFIEKLIVKIFTVIKRLRGGRPRHWICADEKFGHAFVVSWKK